jgi:hypothetical protein
MASWRFTASLNIIFSPHEGPPQAMTIRKEALWGILILALLLRLGALWKLNSKPDLYMGGDAPFYYALGKNILRGEYQITPADTADLLIHPKLKLINNKFLFHTAVVGQPTNYWSPGYPAFLAMIFAIFGVHMLIPALLGCLFGVIICYVIYLLGKKVVNENIGILAALIWALHPLAITKSPELESETLGLLLLLSCLYLFLTWQDKFDYKRGLLLGLFLGLPFYVRSTSGLLLPIFIFMILILPNKQKWATSALLVIGFLVVLLPWGFRNQKSLGEFMLLETRGANVMLGEVSRKSGLPFRMNDVKAETELDSWRQQKMMVGEILRNNPGALIKVGWYHLSSWLFPPGRFTTFRSLINFIFLFSTFFGFYLARHRWRVILPIILFMAAYTCSVLLLMKGDEARFRLPFEALASPFLALTFVEVYNFLSAQKIWNRPAPNTTGKKP